jgi:hypothetical protein
MTIINYASSVVNKLEALLTDNARVVIYNRHVFIVQATEVIEEEEGDVSLLNILARLK